VLLGVAHQVLVRAAAPDQAARRAMVWEACRLVDPSCGGDTHKASIIGAQFSRPSFAEHVYRTSLVSRKCFGPVFKSWLDGAP
jgi:hypothetical protein